MFKQMFGCFLLKYFRDYVHDREIPSFCVENLVYSGHKTNRRQGQDLKEFKKELDPFWVQTNKLKGKGIKDIIISTSLSQLIMGTFS